jgi:hypothetical protein
VAHRRRPIVAGAVTAAVVVAAACQQPAFFTVVIEARRLTSDLRLQFMKVADVSSREALRAGESDAGAGEVSPGFERLRCGTSRSATTGR